MPFFLSFFWEAQDRDRWPMFHPASREGLQSFGLLAMPDDVSDAYLAFREAMGEACQEVGADHWDMEQFLWHHTRPSAPPVSSGPSAPTGAGAAAEGELYAALETAGLSFPDSLVTTLILSLLAKRFVILAGISGTGKTRLPLDE